MSNSKPPSTNFHSKPNRNSKHPNNPFGPSSSSKKPFIRNNQMDPSRVLEPTTLESNQDHKRRCFENLVVRRQSRNIENGVKCSFEVQVIDDTALIDVSVFKKKKSDTGFANNARTKQESGDKVKKNKGFKKTSAKSAVTTAKSVNEKKDVGGRVASEKKVFEVKEVKGFKGYRKTSGKVKAVYVRKDAKVANVVEEQKKVSGDGLIANEKMVSETVQERDVSLIVSEDNEDSVFGQVETDASLNVAKGEDQEESSVESESVGENDDVLKLNLEMDVNVGKIEVEEDRDVCEIENENENVIVGSKKFVYSRKELEALRFVDEDGQLSKWIKVYCAFTPLVAREYAGLVVDASRQPQRYNRVGSCGSIRYPNKTAILGAPPVLPMCSVSSYRKIAPYDRVGFRSNFN